VTDPSVPVLSEPPPSNRIEAAIAASGFCLRANESKTSNQAVDALGAERSTVMPETCSRTRANLT
jgi:hypothetical protein